MTRRVLAVMLASVIAISGVVLDAGPVFAGVNLDVPFIHQENDPPDDPLDDGSWDGNAACGAASAVMIAAYWGKLPPHPCDDCGTDYSWYVNQVYTNSYGNTYSTGFAEPGGEKNTYWGAYGYIYSGTVIVNVYYYLDNHGFDVGYDSSPTENEVKAELDAGYPVYKSTTIYGGHEIVIVGYTDGGNYLVNDPLGDRGSLEYLWSSISSGGMITAHPETGRQTWYLSGTATGSDYVQYGGDYTRGAGTVTITEGAAVEYWRSDGAASGSFTFPAENWNVAVTLNAAPSTGNAFTGHLGSYDPDGTTYTEEDSWSFTGANGAKTYFTATFNPGSVTVPDGDYLAFWVANSDDATNEDIVVKVGSSNSCVISPATDPGYPVPELPTIVLMAVGLAMLGGYATVARHRKARRAKAPPS